MKDLIHVLMPRFAGIALNKGELSVQESSPVDSRKIIVV